MSITQRCSKCGRLIPVSEYSEEGFKRQVCKECEQAEQEAAKPKTKVCECCGRELPIESFYPSKRYKDGYCPKCKECEEFLKSNVEPKFKTCTKCGKTLPTYLFANSKSARDGKNSWCKMCVGEQGKIFRERNKNTPHPPLVSKVCTRCGRELPIESFYKGATKRDGYACWCKECTGKSMSLSRQKKRMQKLIPGWTAPTQGDIDRSVDNIPTQEDIDRSVDNIATPPPPQCAVTPTPPKVEAEPIRPISPTPPTAYPNRRPKTTAPIQERKDWLIKDIRDTADFFDFYPKEMLNEFFLYWSEQTSNGIMRFELEKTWETALRMQRWYDNSKKFNSPAPTPPPQAAAPTPPKAEQDDIDRLVESIPYPPDSPQRTYDLRPPKIKQPVEQATYSPQSLTIRFKAGDKVIRLKDGIFLLEQLSGKAQVNMGEKPEILYETTDLDMVADKDLFKNKREALERTKLAGIPEERLTYGNKPIK